MLAASASCAGLVEQGADEPSIREAARQLAAAAGCSEPGAVPLNERYPEPSKAAGTSANGARDVGRGLVVVALLSLDFGRNSRGS